MKSTIQKEAYSPESIEIWNKEYPDEPFKIFHRSDSPSSDFDKEEETTINYDLIAAVKRQSSFFYQVLRALNLPNKFLGTNSFSVVSLRYRDPISKTRTS